MLYDEILKMDEYTNTNLNSVAIPSPETVGNWATDGTWIAGTDDHNFCIDPDATYTFSTPWKYNEEEIVKELLEYIRGTYRQHYSAGDDKIQTLDLIEACGDGESFCRSNILKYASRYDKKGTARRDILKILHYAVLLMHFNDKNAKRETYPQ
jgi:hypothetical protein